MNLFSYYPSRSSLTGRRRYRLHSRFGSTLLVLQVEVRYSSYNPIAKAYKVDTEVWRDAKIEDLTIGVMDEQETTNSSQG